MRNIFALLFFLSTLAVRAQVHDFNLSVRFELEIPGDKDAIILRWTEESNANGYVIRKRPAGQGNFIQIASLDQNALSYRDENIEIGTAYEYEVRKNFTHDGSTGNGFGYAWGGIELPVRHHRGTILLMCEEEAHQRMTTKIERWKSDLESDGWTVIIRTAPRDAIPPQIKSIIQTEYQNSDRELTTVCLFGRIPVPYSGNIFPDGHPDHQGAWPADVYYADMDGSWTDQFVNITVANAGRHHNVPGDGKFDQSQIPSDAELEIGRIDFANMPAFALSEMQLLEQYLDKNHAFRNGQVQMPRRALIQNNFPSFAEAFGQTALNNFSRFFGIENVAYLPYRSTLQQEAYLWSYGCGPGGYTSTGGVINTNNFTTDSIQSVFTVLFGSYFGDWDSQNNMLRAPLASRGPTLTNIWAGRPVWHLQHMAAGQHIGASTRLTQNNSFFPTGFGARFIHVALMGDPSLHMYPYIAIQELSAQTDNYNVRLSWTPEDEYQNGSFYVYRKSEDQHSFELLHEEALQTHEYIDSCVMAGQYSYMVRAVKEEKTGSGSFMNLSIGQISDVSVIEDFALADDFEVDVLLDLLVASADIVNADEILWTLGGHISFEHTDEIEYLFEEEGLVEICLSLGNECTDVVVCKVIEIISSLPTEIIENISAPLCHNDENGSILLHITGLGHPYEVTWDDGSTGLQINNIGAGLYESTVKSITGREQKYDFLLVEPESLEFSTETMSSNQGGNNGEVKVVTNGGTPPYSIEWSDGNIQFERLDIAAGNYAFTITDANDCSITGQVEIHEISSVIDTKAKTINAITWWSGPTKLIVDFDGTSSPGQINLFDLSGRCIYSKQIPANSFQLEINAEHWPGGLYIWILDFNGFRLSDKVFKP
jgi:hypothetical protein